MLRNLYARSTLVCHEMLIGGPQCKLNIIPPPVFSNIFSLGMPPILKRICVPQVGKRLRNSDLNKAGLIFESTSNSAPGGCPVFDQLAAVVS